MKNGTVSLDKVTMDYVSFGHGPKNVIIIPGLSDGLATVKGKALFLSAPYKEYFDSFTIYMFSRRNDLPAGFSIKDMADDQARALKELGIEKTSVLGVSQGGMIAQELAIDYPGLIEKAVIAVSAPSVNEVIKERLDRWISLAEKGDHKELMIDTAENSYSESYLSKYRKAYPLLGHIGRPKDYKRFLANAKAILAFNSEDDLPKIKCPVLIIAGSDDRIVGVDASKRLHGLIKDSELYIYEGLGHAAYEEAKDFNKRVFAFLGR